MKVAKTYVKRGKTLNESRQKPVSFDGESLSGDTPEQFISELGGEIYGNLKDIMDEADDDSYVYEYVERWLALAKLLNRKRGSLICFLVGDICGVLDVYQSSFRVIIEDPDECEVFEDGAEDVCERFSIESGVNFTLDRENENTFIVNCFII